MRLRLQCDGAWSNGASALWLWGVLVVLSRHHVDIMIGLAWHPRRDCGAIGTRFTRGARSSQVEESFVVLVVGLQGIVEVVPGDLLLELCTSHMISGGLDDGVSV